MTETSPAPSPEANNRRIDRALGAAERIGTAAFTTLTLGALGVGPHADIDYTTSHTDRAYSIDGSILCGSEVCTSDELAAALEFENFAAVDGIPENAISRYDDGRFTLFWLAEGDDSTEQVVVRIKDLATCNGEITDLSQTHVYEHAFPLGLPLPIRLSKLAKLPGMLPKGKRKDDSADDAADSTTNETDVSAGNGSKEVERQTPRPDVKEPDEQAKKPKPEAGAGAGSGRTRDGKWEEKRRKRVASWEKKQKKIYDDIARKRQKTRRKYDDVFKRRTGRQPWYRPLAGRRGPLRFIGDAAETVADTAGNAFYTTIESRMGRTALAGLVAGGLVYGYYKVPVEFDTCFAGVDKESDSFDPNIDLRWDCSMPDFGGDGNDSTDEAPAARPAPVPLGEKSVQFVFGGCDIYSITGGTNDDPDRLNRLEKTLVRLFYGELDASGQGIVNRQMSEVWNSGLENPRTPLALALLERIEEIKHKAD